MSNWNEPMLVFRNDKTGKDMHTFLIQTIAPRIGDAVVSSDAKLYRVMDVVWHSYWSRDGNGRINTEIRIHVELEKRERSK